MNSWEYVSSKLGRIDDETLSIAKELYDVASANGHEIWFMWGMGSSAEHSTGNALDLMIRNEAGGDFIRDYIWRNRARLRLKHVIWEQHITSTIVRPGVRRKMNDRGNTTENHYDHVHVLFSEGEYVAPESSVHTPPTTAKNPSGVVSRIQFHHEVENDGMWGPDTDGRVMFMRAFSYSHRGWPVNRAANLNREQLKMAQRVIDTPDDGIIGPNSMRALDRWVKEMQSIMGVSADGQWGPKTDGRLLALRRRHRGNY